MKIVRNASVAWQGAIKTGKGEITTQSGAPRAYPYGFPGATTQQFDAIAARAKAECPVSKLFNAPITLQATLA